MFNDFGSDGREVYKLMPGRIVIICRDEGKITSAAADGTMVNETGDVRFGKQGSPLGGMPELRPPSALGCPLPLGRCRMAGKVCGGWAGGIRGVLPELAFEFFDSFLESGEMVLHGKHVIDEHVL